MRRATWALCVASLFGVACGRIGFEGERPDAAPPRDAAADATVPDARADGAAHDAAMDATVLPTACAGEWGAPALIESLDAVGIDDDPSFTADLLELYFASQRPGGPGGPGATNLWRSVRASVNEPWGVPTLVADVGPVNTPHVSGDGLSLHLSRSSGMADEDIFVMTRASRTADWSPATIVANINVPGYSDKAAAVYAGGLRMIFASNRPGTEGDLDFYLARRDNIADEWGVDVQHLTDVSTTKFETRAWLIESGERFYFHSIRSAVTTSDIYVATYSDLTHDYGDVQRIDALSSDLYDEDVTVSNDECYAIFASTRIGGDSALFESHRAP